MVMSYGNQTKEIFKIYSQTNGNLTLDQYAKLFDLSPDTIKNHLKNFKEDRIFTQKKSVQSNIAILWKTMQIVCLKVAAVLPWTKYSLANDVDKKKIYLELIKSSPQIKRSLFLQEQDVFVYCEFFDPKSLTKFMTENPFGKYLNFSVLVCCKDTEDVLYDLKIKSQKVTEKKIFKNDIKIDLGNNCLVSFNDLFNGKFASKLSKEITP